MALRSGRVGAPFSSSALQRVLGSVGSAGVVDWLNTVEAKGCSGEACALWLELLAESNERQDVVERMVQMVSTAPSCDSTMHRDTAVVVQDLLRRATRSLLIATYGIYGGREIFRTLGERMENHADLRVRLFLNVGGDGNPVEYAKNFRRYQWPEEKPLPEVYYEARAQISSSEGETAVMHAKCVVMDGQEVLVTSANFTEAAQHRNVEVGLLVRSEVIGRQITDFFDGLVRTGWCSLLRF